MFARNVTLHLKADKANEFTRTLESDVLPLLRRQAGFEPVSPVARQSGMTLVIPLIL